MTESHRLNPEAFSGKAYWSISPPLKSNGITSGGLRIGIESDTEYLNPWMAKLMSMVLSVPAQNIRASSSEEFYMELCSRLLADESLSFISVWSPNYFLQLHNFILKNREVLFNNNYLSEKKKNIPFYPRDFISVERIISESNFNQLLDRGSVGSLDT